jgi:hypothetical protein
VTKRLLLSLAATVLTLSWVGAAPLAQATSYTACDGVWVVVDYGSLGGGVKTSCATSFSTGTAALRSAGFDPTLSDGFVAKISGRPSKPDPQKDYWSYWHATRKSDGSYGNWSYSTAGSNAFHPAKGNAEGWHYVSLSETASGPDATPANNPAASVTATPTATKTATAKATKKATATTKATTTTSATTKVSASASTSTTSSPVQATASATPSATASQTPSVTVSDVAADAPSATTDGEPTPGSPVGTIAAGVAVIAAVGGLGSWWLTKGRHS